MPILRIWDETRQTYQEVSALVGPQGPEGPAGADGVPGPVGATGQAATIQVGATTTGEPGTNAAVTNSGTSSAAILNFTIPRGATGEPGQTGPAGPNEVSTSTNSVINGLLKGAAGKVAQAEAGTDYEAAGAAASAVATHNTTADAHSELLAGKADASHTQAASTIPAGTLAGQVVANSTGQTYSTSLLRNSRLVSVETAPTVNGEICWTYE